MIRSKIESKSKMAELAGAVAVFFVEAGVAVFEGDFVAGDQHVLHVAANVQDVAVGRKQAGFFAGFDAAEAVAQAQQLRGVEGDALQSLVFRVAEGDGLRDSEAAAAGRSRDTF